LENDIKGAIFETYVYKDSGTCILKGIDDLVSQFEEFSIKVAALRSNQFSVNFNQRISKVERDIKVAEDVLEEWIKAQKSWMYLEPIFQSEDISKQMPSEAQVFTGLDQFYRNTIRIVLQDPTVVKVARKDGLLVQLLKTNQQFEVITRGLSNYLEAKREYFSRFYFLSNEEIIEILGQMREPRNIQRFLNKIFEGIDNLSFQANGEVTAIHSKEGESVKLVNSIMANISAERWLKKLEAEMKKTIKSTIFESLRDKTMRNYQDWVKFWPGQIIMVVTRILFTQEMNETLGK
jgi:dynein heavy chain